MKTWIFDPFPQIIEAFLANDDSDRLRSSLLTRRQPRRKTQGHERPPDPLRLVVASRNRGKLREIRELLEPEGIAVVGIDSFPNVPEATIEDGDSFA